MEGLGHSGSLGLPAGLLRESEESGESSQMSSLAHSLLPAWLFPVSSRLFCGVLTRDAYLCLIPKETSDKAKQREHRKIIGLHSSKTGNAMQTESGAISGPSGVWVCVYISFTLN